MNVIQVISLTLLSVLAASAQTLLPGKCAKPAVQQNFDPSRYLGKWYEIQKLPNLFQRGECGTATYGLRSPGVIDVLNQELLADGNINAASGTAKVVDPSEPAKLEVSFFENSPAGPYWVLSTDHEGHSLVYGCTDYLGLFHVEFAWILARQPTLPDETIEELHSILTDAEVDVSKMTATKQDADYCSAMPQ